MSLSMSGPAEFGYGVIEGFFGKAWSWEERIGYARFLRQSGFDFYLYAPKSDTHLRRKWRAPWPEAEARKITELAIAYRKQGVKFGIGLSPFELYLDYGTAAKSDLRAKVSELNAVGPDILAAIINHADAVAIAIESQAQVESFIGHGFYDISQVFKL